jgi:DNA topoisomerase VI subunit B
MNTPEKGRLSITSSTDDSHVFHPQAVEVYNLLVLVRQQEGRTFARAANLEIEEVQANTVREAISALVADARQYIQVSLSANKPIAWTSPPRKAAENEQPYMVPLHL